MKTPADPLFDHLTVGCKGSVMVTRSGLNHAPRRGQRCSVKHTTWQHPIHKEIADIGLLLAKLCQKMCYISQPYDKNREEE